MNPRLINRSHARRLAVSYLLAFALVFALLIVAIHFAFAVLAAEQEQQRLHTLLSLEIGEADVSASGVDISEDEVGSAIDPTQEGVQWFSASGKLLAQRGLTLPAAGVPADGEHERVTQNGVSLSSLSAAVHDTGGNRTAAFVRVTRSDRASLRNLRKLDIGLLCGFLVALGIGGFGGRYLARASLAKIEKNLHTMETFTADAAHELRAPLATIVSNAQASLREHDRPAPEPHHARLEAIAQAASRMQRLADDLLILARADRSIERDLFVIDVGERTREVANRFAAAAAHKEIALEVVTASHPRMYGNPDQVDRIIANLIDNAIRYTDPGGTVIVTCREAPGGASVTIADSGIGIALGDQQRIFERFWRGDPVRSIDGGSGLGLAIVQALARRHGAQITLTSAPRKGSEFTVCFPARPPAQGAP
jgi:OmpR-family two-component system manganese-sensing sensor histidine kinase